MAALKNGFFGQETNALGFFSQPWAYFSVRFNPVFIQMFLFEITDAWLQLAPHNDSISGNRPMNALGCATATKQLHAVNYVTRLTQHSRSFCKLPCRFSTNYWPKALKKYESEKISGHNQLFYHSSYGSAAHAL
jgi:hypothetical protein